MLLRIFAEKLSASVWVFAILAIGILGTGQAYAQVAGATLTGTVADASGSAIPKAQLTITDVSTGVARDTETDNAGFYSAPNLLPGTYEVKVTVAGFRIAVQRGITLTVGAQRVLNITMQVGQITQTIQITGEAPDIQLASSAITDTVGSTTVRELPLNGRSWTDLATLQPGVQAIQAQIPFTAGASRSARGYGNQIVISGARPQVNNYRLDGISINDPSNGGPGSVLGGNLGVDAIQEFSVLTSSYSTEYGRTAGGVVNAITRSGTNEFHGGVYEFLRNNALDARNFFDKKIPPFRRNQFGADGGGPVWKNKLFIFGDYEGIRQSKGITSVGTAPSVAARSGILCSAPDTTPACTPTPIPGGVDAAAGKYLPFWPLPNRGNSPGTNGDIGIFSFAVQQVVSENFFTTRVDYNISDKDTLTGTYVSDITPYTAPDTLDAILFTNKTNRQIAILEETHIFSAALVNSVRLGYSREAGLENAATTVVNPLAKDLSLGAVPGEFAAAVNVTGLTTFTGGVNGGNYGIHAWNSFQEYDDAFWTHGTHSLKFGGAVERMQSNSSGGADLAGVFKFGSLSDFLTNVPQAFNAGFRSGQTTQGFRETLFGLYTQDDWHARPNLTVNLGLRWEMVTVMTDVHGKIGTLINLTDPQHHCGILVEGCSSSGPLFPNPTLRNFEPRVGFSWDPFHNGKTALRSGFGVFDSLPLIVELVHAGGIIPFSASGAVNGKKLPPGSFFTGAAPLLGLTTGQGFYIDQHPHRNYVMQWNLNVQRELTPNVAVLVGYVGSRGVHQPTHVDDANIVLPTMTPQGYLYPNPVGSGTPINPNLGLIRSKFYNGNSFYDALQMSVQKKMSHGVQLQGSFTWGKSIDTSSSTVSGDQFSNSISSQLPWTDLKLGRGLSDFNIGRTLVINGIWDVPSPKSLSGPAGWITNGWELGAIYKASDGIPFTATFGTNGDPQGIGNGDPWDFPNRLTGPGCQSLVNPGNPNNYIKTQCFAIPTAPSVAFFNMPAPLGCDPAFGQSTDPTAPHYLWCFNLRGNSGRNVLTGPGTSNLDFSVFKNNYVKRVSENFNVQFRAEVFNILNHANFAVPVTPDHTDIFDSTGTPTGVAGLLTSTTTTAREIQFALKIVW